MEATQKLKTEFQQKPRGDVMFYKFLIIFVLTLKGSKSPNHKKFT